MSIFVNFTAVSWLDFQLNIWLGVNLSEAQKLIYIMAQYFNQSFACKAFYFLN